LIKSDREKVKIIFLFLGIILWMFLFIFNITYALSKAPTLRVGIFLNINELSIGGEGSLEIYNLKSNQLIGRERGEPVKISSNPKGIKILGKGVYSGPIKAIPASGTKLIVLINGQKYKYRGNIEIDYDKVNNKLNVINLVGIEEYLYGVLKKEISPKWPMETLKAQAIAARTFALFNMNKYIEKGYNLDATTNSQAYGGVNHEHPLTNKAVDATRGKIMVFKGEAINAVYHSDSGGYTANSEDVWGSYLPYLRGVKSTFEENVSPTHHTWDFTISESNLIQKLEKIGYVVDSIIDIKLEKDKQSGRVNQLSFVCVDNKIVNMDSKTFRSMIGFDVIRSTLFNFEKIGQKPVSEEEKPFKKIIDNDAKEKQSVEEILELKKDWTIKELLELMKETQKEEKEKKEKVIKIKAETVYSGVPLSFKFTGMGNGHGVGMSQWGAYGMALQGNDYQEILNYYYQGIDIEKKY